MTRRVLPAWPLRVTVRRLADQWRLLLVVLAVATVASTLITSLGSLVVATEQGGLRSALSRVDRAEARVDVTVFRTDAGLGVSRDQSDKAIAHLLGPGASIASDGVAESTLLPVPQFDAALPAFTYFGELDSVTKQSTLVAGEWATAATNGDVPVTLPEAAAIALGLTVGDTFVVDTGDNAEATATVAGIYASVEPKGAYWSRDTMGGTGDEPEFPKPDSAEYVPLHVFGPLVVASGSMDAADVPARILDVRYSPTFDRFAVAELPGLLDRLDDIDTEVPASIGNVSQLVLVTTGLGEVFTDAASALVVTRSAVVVVALLLLVLALAALVQTARLLTDSRATERRLMRVRGVSTRQLIGVALVEALALAAVTMLLAVPLASLVYRALAAQQPMVEAGMPASVGLLPVSWLAASVVAVLLVVVLVVPLLGKAARSLETTVPRRRRAAGIARSGLDLGVVAIAAVVYWQLWSYRSPVSQTASLAIDPVLVAGPAIVLLAGALVGARVIPLATRVLETLGSRGRGTVLPLALWEVGRRSHRAVAVVLLLTLTLATATFSASFLTTWRQSQTDQAQLAIGAPVRVAADPENVFAQSAELGDGAVGAPQPATRRVGQVAAYAATSESGEPPTGPNALVLGLTPAARAMIDRGRLATEGGSTIGKTLGTDDSAITSVALPGEVSGIAVRARIGEMALPGTSSWLRAIVENADGLQTVVDLGSVPVDGQAHDASGRLAATTALRLVGFQVELAPSPDEDVEAEPDDSAVVGDTAADLLIGDLAVLHAAAADKPDDVTSEPVTVDPALGWFSRSSNDPDNPPLTTDVPAGWQFRLAVSIPPYSTVPSEVFVPPSEYVLMGWKPIVDVPIVLTTAVADIMRVTEGAPLTVVIGGTQVSGHLAATTDLVPGTANGGRIGGADAAADPTQGVAVVDQVTIERALAQLGDPSPSVDEWWVDVVPGEAVSYLRAHPVAPGFAPTLSSETIARDLQQGPLRVATLAALWLAIAAAAILAALGFAVHTSSTLAARRRELAQLRAIGLSRRALVGTVALESLLYCVVGGVFGIGLGALLAWLIAPLISVSPEGVPTVPSVLVDVPWQVVVILVAEIVLVVVVVVIAAARAQRATDPAQILREGGE